MKNQFKVNDIVVTSNNENFFLYDKDYLILKIKEIKIDKRGNIHYKCKVLNDDLDFSPYDTYTFFNEEIQQPDKNQLIEINKNYLRRK